MQDNLTQLGAHAAPREAAPHIPAAVPTSYVCTSASTGSGLRRHTLSTQSRVLARLFEEAALNVDDQPDFVAYSGTYSVQFYADDAECQQVIALALGGVA